MKIIISLVFYSLIPAISYAQSGWFIQYQNADYYLPSNCFTDVNTGYFAGARYPVGQGPLVIKTTNAGQNWLLIDSSGGTTGYFNDTVFKEQSASRHCHL